MESEYKVHCPSGLHMKGYVMANPNWIHTCDHFDGAKQFVILLQIGLKEGALTCAVVVHVIMAMIDFPCGISDTFVNKINFDHLLYEPQDTHNVLNILI